MTTDKQRYESWQQAHEENPDRPLLFASTVVLLRDQPVATGGSRLEVLMVKRAKQLAFGGGSWVFPGGRVDAADHEAAGQVEQLAETGRTEPAAPKPDLPAGLPAELSAGFAAAEFAGVRETMEETGVSLQVSELVCYSHWVPPPIAPKRFATWFFLAAVEPDRPIAVDGSEIVESQWMPPAEVLRLCNEKAMEMLPPTFVTLTELAGCADCAAAVELARGRTPPLYATKIAVLDDVAVSLWEGDAGYDSQDPAADGPRHRLLMSEQGWEYQRSG